MEIPLVNISVSFNDASLCSISAFKYSCNWIAYLQYTKQFVYYWGRNLPAKLVNIIFAGEIKENILNQIIAWEFKNVYHLMEMVDVPLLFPYAPWLAVWSSICRLMEKNIK